MPYLPNPITFIGLKFAGYTIAGTALSIFYKSKTNPFLFGLVRVVTGLGLGLFTGIIFSPLFANAIAAYIWLISLRLFVWGILLWYFYERKSFKVWRFALLIALGTGWSFLLDLGSDYLTKMYPDQMQIPWC
jgi:hypothetical protein